MRDSVLEKLVAWGEAHPAVRAMILTSSRARPDGPVDALSDYDVIVAVDDVDAFLSDERWIGDYGRPMVRWGDAHELFGQRTFFRGVVYEDGVKIDWTLWPAALLERVAHEPLPEELDVGYRVLLDKDGATSEWPPPAYRAHIPPKPTQAQYVAEVEEFWWGTTYVAKALWRGEIVFAKFVLDYDLKLQSMRRVLEWRIELDHDWNVKPGVFGRGLERLLPPDVAAELLRTYVGPEPDENWAALFRTTALFRRVASDVGTALGYAYPHDVDDRVSAYLATLR